MINLKDLNTNLPETLLCDLGRKHQTDKPAHGYTKIYYELMKDFQNKRINLFEIGIYTGASIRMWHEFLIEGNIFGIDNGRIVPGSMLYAGNSNESPTVDDIRLLEIGVRGNFKFTPLENERVKCFVADQRSEEQLEETFEYFGCKTFDFIIDDGHHFQEHQQKSLALLFPHIKSGGYYIIEDVIPQHAMINGSFWGQSKKDATDSTDYIFSKFIETGKLESIHMSSDQIEYITNNIEDVFLYDELNKNNSPINLTAKLLVIKKK